MIKVAPSILSAEFCNLKQALDDLVAWKADWAHCDVMDGCFVSNITFGQGMVASLKKFAKLPLDVHLMVDRPERYVDEFVDAGADYLGIHYEACTHVHGTLQRIRERGAKATLTLNPGTPVCMLDSLYEYCDMILFMSVNPGFGGQSFISNVYAKLESAANAIARRGLSCELEVDGGVNEKNAQSLIDAGATVLVAGSAVFGAKDPAAMVQKLRGRA